MTSNWDDFTAKFQAALNLKPTGRRGRDERAIDERAVCLEAAREGFESEQESLKGLYQTFLLQLGPSGPDNPANKLIKSAVDMQSTVENNSKRSRALDVFGRALLAYNRQNLAEPLAWAPQKKTHGREARTPREGAALLIKYSMETTKLLHSAMDEFVSMERKDALLFKPEAGLDLSHYSPDYPGSDPMLFHDAKQIMKATLSYFAVVGCDLVNLRGGEYNSIRWQHDENEAINEEIERRLDQADLVLDSESVPTMKSFDTVLDNCILARKNSIDAIYETLEELQYAQRIEGRAKLPTNKLIAATVSERWDQLMFAYADMLHYRQTKLDLLLLTFHSSPLSDEAKQMCDLHSRLRSDIWRLYKALESLRPDVTPLAPGIRLALTTELHSRVGDYQTQCAFLTSKGEALRGTDGFVCDQYKTALDELIICLGNAKDAIRYYVIDTTNRNPRLTLTDALRSEAREFLETGYRSLAETAQEERKRALLRQTLTEETAPAAVAGGQAVSLSGRKKKTKRGASLPAHSQIPPSGAGGLKNSPVAAAIRLSELRMLRAEEMPLLREKISREMTVVLENNPQMSPLSIKQRGEWAAAYLDDAISVTIDLIDLTKQSGDNESPVPAHADAVQLGRELEALQAEHVAVQELAQQRSLYSSRALFIAAPTLELFNDLVESGQIERVGSEPRRFVLGARDAKDNERRPEHMDTVYEYAIKLSGSNNPMEQVVVHFHYDRLSGRMGNCHFKKWPDRLLGNTSSGLVYRGKISGGMAVAVMEKLDDLPGATANGRVPRSLDAIPRSAWA